MVSPAVEDVAAQHFSFFSAQPLQQKQVLIYFSFMQK